MCPVTTVKTRMEASGAAAAAYAYRSVPQALSLIVRTEGPLALWRGLAPALLSNVPFSALHYAAYSYLREELGRRQHGGWTKAACPASGHAPIRPHGGCKGSGRSHAPRSAA